MFFVGEGVHVTSLKKFGLVERDFFLFWTAPWWKWGTQKVLKVLPLSLLFCLCVCYQATGHSFRPSNLNFLKTSSISYGKKVLFRFLKFSFLIFLGPFFTSFFSEFFPLCLCIGHKTPHPVRPTTFFFRMLAKYGIKRAKTNLFLKIFIFDNLRASFRDFWRF